MPLEVFACGMCHLPHLPRGSWVRERKYERGLAKSKPLCFVSSENHSNVIGHICYSKSKEKRKEIFQKYIVVLQLKPRSSEHVNKAKLTYYSNVSPCTLSSSLWHKASLLVLGNAFFPLEHWFSSPSERINELLDKMELSQPLCSCTSRRLSANSKVPRPAAFSLRTHWVLGPSLSARPPWIGPNCI